LIVSKPELVEAGGIKVHRYLHHTVIKEHGIKIGSATISMYDSRSFCWQDNTSEDMPHLAFPKPKLSQGEGSEMELQLKIK